MENNNSLSSSECSSPIFNRRRLSAPETVMRRHSLAQQRLLEETSSSQSSSVRSYQHWHFEADAGSDTNLNKRDQPGLLWKTTLLRRMRSTKPFQQFSCFGSCGKLASGRKSKGSSPEHRRCSVKTSSSNLADSAFTNSSTYSSDVQKVAVEEEAVRNSETQTVGATNVNVISNVKLSQSTLDLIYSQVLRDVQNKAPDAVRINTLTKSERVNAPFYLKQEKNNDLKNTQIVRCMISNVHGGSVYNETPRVVVPRLSALPHSTSMEVNTSESEKDSEDTLSLADSLENEKTHKHKSKPYSFFVPIDADCNVCPKSVSDHLPESVRSRLNQRQRKRAQKKKAASESRLSSSGFTSTSEVNTNTAGDVNSNRCPSRTRTVLPTIQTVRKIKFVGKDATMCSYKHCTTTKSSYWVPSKRVGSERLSPLRTSQKECVYTPEGNRIYHKTEMNKINKRIEILEIMECSEGEDKVVQSSKNKSRIPVFVQNKLPKISSPIVEKPTFLDLKPVPIGDIKSDQLIANILIDNLNHEEKINQVKEVNENANYNRKIDVIPEELSLQSSNVENNGNFVGNLNYKGKEALGLLKDDNLATIPQGWVTFYMLQKSQGTPDSTSDEGEKRKEDSCVDKPLEETKNLRSSESNGSTKSGNLPELQRNNQRYRKSVTTPLKEQPGGWSVTVSGTMMEQYAPSLEMRLKFGKMTPEAEIKRVEVMKREEDSFSNSNEASYVESCRLPEINPRFKRKITRYEEPRQTKTSSRRILLHKPKNTTYTEKQLQEVLNQIPHFLSIIGSAINPKKKSSLYYIQPNF